MKEIDCRGLACPQPVLNAKDALEEIESGVIKITVDNQPARDNVTRFVKSQGCSVESIQDGDNYVLTITKGEGGDVSGRDAAPESSTGLPRLVVKIPNRYMGSGSDELGRILMKAFIKTLSEATIKPSAIIFYNSGVYLTCGSSECLADIKALEEKGVEIFSCGTCLDFFSIKDDLAVGNISNMFEIVETLSAADRIVTP